MAAAKKRTIRRKKVTEIDFQPSESWQDEKENLEAGQTPKKSSKVRNIIFILILLSGLLFWKFKGYFVAALVNGQPISRWELSSVLSRRFGEQTLENIVNERLILAAARQKGIFVSTKDIDDKINDVKNKLEGRMTLDEALNMQGLTKDEFRRQIEIQLSIDKLFDKETTVSATEIEDYIQKNSSISKTATDPAMLREDVKAMLKQQKMTETFDNWFTEIRKNAKIQKFL